MARTNVDFYRSVKLNITVDEAKKYQPFHKGLDINFYAPIDDRGRNLLHKPGYNTKKINYLDATFTAKSINPNPLLARDMRDIDEELAVMDESFRVVQDHLKGTDNKRLIHLHQSEKTLLRHAVVLDHPYLDGENDKYRSTATEVHDVRVPVELVREQESRFEKRKAFYNRSKIQYLTELDKPTNRKMAVMKMGWIGNHDDVPDSNVRTDKDRITTTDSSDNNG